MGILSFLREYWVIITAFVGEIGVLILFVRSIIEASKCSLRNDILDIYDRCKETGKITHYQLQSIKTSYDVYKKLKGNSFVEDIVKRVEDFELID
jgi:hypothetical protein